ncbi:MAG: glycosyltransferase family 2 protein [Dysgonomonas sp.]|nr:glycosyltransferase family 2 protein [Dysgonomonas sp.]
MPKVSVILPVYNAERYLYDAISSVIGQTFTDWELVIINDGSTDDSHQIISKFTDNRIHYYQNKNNLGLIKTLNKAISLSCGEYIARMDADDICLSTRFERQVEFLDEHPDYAMCGSWVNVIDENSAEKGKILNFTNNEYLQIHLLFSVPFVHPTVMIRTEVLKDNLYDETFKHIEDYELWCRIVGKYKVANVPYYLLNYRWHSTNISVLNSQTQKKLKNTINERELSKIGITPTKEELFLHQITFQQYTSTGNIPVQPFEDFEALNKWFAKIIDANKKYNKYDFSSLLSYLWSRWIVLCLTQKKIDRIFNASFIPFSLKVFIKTARLLFFYSKK